LRHSASVGVAMVEECGPAHRKEAAGPGQTPRNILLQAEGWSPGPPGDDLLGLVDRVSDASDAAGPVDDGEERALRVAEPALVLWRPMASLEPLNTSPAWLPRP
jgi:hypothetical protein